MCRFLLALIKHGNVMKLSIIFSSRSEVNKFVVPRELSRANSNEKKTYIYRERELKVSVQLPGNSVTSLTSDRWIVGTQVVNKDGGRSTVRTFYQCFCF